MTSIRNRLTTTEIDLALKVEKKEFEAIASRVKDLPTQEEFYSFQTRIENILKKFKESNNLQKAQNEDQIAIITRYDEVISDKVSKHSLQEIQT